MKPQEFCWWLSGVLSTVGEDGYVKPETVKQIKTSLLMALTPDPKPAEPRNPNLQSLISYAKQAEYEKEDAAFRLQQDAVTDYSGADEKVKGFTP
jgi:hypothetical protein